MVFTPHNSAWWNRYYQEKVVALTEEFRRRLKAENLDLQVAPGCEIYIDLDILKRIKDGRAAPLNDSHYLLVELPFTSWPLYADQVFFELQAAGYTVILAHPERYSAVMEKPERMMALAERGIIGQVTSGSLEGKFGSKAQKTGMLLLENNWAHYIASDAHELTNRTPTHERGTRSPVNPLWRRPRKGDDRYAARAYLPQREVTLDPPLEYEGPQQRSFLDTLFRR